MLRIIDPATARARRPAPQQNDGRFPHSIGSEHAAAFIVNTDWTPSADGPDVQDDDDLDFARKMLTRFLISLYICKTGVASGFGAAGSVAVIFVWVYYSAQVFLVGAEFTWVYAQRFGSRRHRAEPTPEQSPVAPAIPERSKEGTPDLGNAQLQPLPDRR